MPLERFCRNEVVTVGADATVVEAARRMLEHHVGSVVVVRDGAPVGMLTDRDIVLRAVAQSRPLNTPVKEVMSENVLTASVDDGIDDAVRYMREGHVRRLPVVRPDGHLAGLVSLDDLVVLLGAELSELAKTVRANRGP